MGTLESATSHIYKQIGRRVREIRMAKGLTQSDLATAIGLTRTSITNIEKGRQKLLVHTLLDIARSLGVKCDTLLITASTNDSPIPTLNIAGSVSEKDRAMIESAIHPAKEKNR